MTGAWIYDDLDDCPYPPIDWEDFGHVDDDESFAMHYGDEIEGRAEYGDPAPRETLALRNAPGQLSLDLGAAYR